MLKRWIFPAALGLASVALAQPKAVDPVAARAARIAAKVDADLPDLEALYKQLHAKPELSGHEVQTAGRMTRELKDAGFTVTTGVGGHGVVGVLANGKGPTILVRTDLDALPITENTGLPYASKERARNRQGEEVGVMHACGHDVHMTCWVGTARALASMKDAWAGTLVFIGQPAEETGEGARGMLEDGLFTRFPKPDFALALHTDNQLTAGHIAVSDGLSMANVDSVDITVKGRGGHGATPHLAIDPIVLAARIVLDLQTIVSREVKPTDPAVVTVGSFHGGTKHNIIPAEVKLLVTVRTTTDATRKQVLEAIERIAKAAAVGARAPEPEVRVRAEEFTPALVNDKALSQKVMGIARSALGQNNVHPKALIMGGEDFSRYARAGVPACMFWLGTIAPERIAESEKPTGKPLPPMHSEFYYPDYKPSIRTGVTTMTQAVLGIVGK
jgi:hippurate hydrolase